MYQVPATSALVLLFTEADVYEGNAAKRLFASLDLSAGHELRAHFTEHWDVAYTAIKTRKVRVRQLSQEYLRTNPSAQVISLGGGLDPMTIDLAELFPQASVFDVDMSQMDVKATINAAVDGPKLKFVTANLGDTDDLVRVLQTHGWDAERPTLVVAEGITYYVPAPVFAQALGAVRTDGGALVLEYSLQDEEITDVNYRDDYINFYTKLAELLNLPFPLVRYTTEYVQQLAAQLGGTLVRTLTEHHTEMELKGFTEFFHDPDAGGIRVALITF